MLIGRRLATSALRSAVDAAAGGAGGVVLLAGEAGMGKTALAAEAVAYAKTRGVGGAGALGEIAVQHRERLDGRPGTRAGCPAARSRPARVLGAADAYASMREPRPHRPARSAAEAAAEMRPSAGRLNGAATDAVLEAAGHRLPRRREALTGPAGLTAREVEVLVLLARGLSNKQIAERLVITPKTAGNHVEHIYTKIDASSRAAAAMFAVQHGLLPEETVAAPARP